MLIIDHGEEYMSLYGNIGEFLLPVEQLFRDKELQLRKKWAI